VTTLDRYITREFLRLFFLILAAFVSLYVVIDFFEKIRMFLSKNATIKQIASFFFFNIPQIVSLTTPVAVLLAVLITFGTMARYNEVLAMKANGISLRRASLPVLVIAAVICLCLFVLNEFVTPASNLRADTIKNVEVRKRKSLTAFKHHQLWYRGKQGIYNFQFFDPETRTLRGITINYLDRDLNLIERMDAESAEWTGDRWVCHKVLITRFPSGGFPKLIHREMLVMDIPETPEDFLVVQKAADKMGFVELRTYVAKLQEEGHDATRYRADMYAKIAFPLVVIILAVLGVSFSLKSERKSGPMQSIGAGIAIGFSYWILHALSLSFGRSGAIPPLAAAWIANIVLGIPSIVMFWRIRT
jgi:lipopolysaccharide export system permease protein